jgi:predicted nucleic acid-binding protein
MFVEEDGTSEVRDAAQETESLATCRIAIVEMRSALARMRSEGRIGDQAHDRVVSELREFWRDLAIVELDEAVARSAAELTTTHLLRAYDAVHLAAALQLRQLELEFACWDRTLRAAAARELLSVLPALK